MQQKCLYLFTGTGVCSGCKNTRIFFCIPHGYWGLTLRAFGFGD